MLCKLFFGYAPGGGSPDTTILSSLMVKNRVCILNGDTELARAVDVVMAQAKRIYILIIKVNKLFSFFLSWYFLKEIENMCSVFLSSYTKV